MNRPIIVILLIVIVAGVAIYFYQSKKTKSNPMWSSTPAQTGVWGAPGVPAYQCPSCPMIAQTSATKYCIIGNTADAQACCAKDPTCVGYYSTGPGWNQLTQSASLVAGSGNWFPKLHS